VQGRARSPIQNGAQPTARGAHHHQYVDQLDDVIDLAGGGRRVVVRGHSLGGFLARLYTGRQPDKVTGLVLVDATPPELADERAVAIGFNRTNATTPASAVGKWSAALGGSLSCRPGRRRTEPPTSAGGGPWPQAVRHSG